MTVKELIEELKKFPEDAPIYLDLNEDEYPPVTDAVHVAQAAVPGASFKDAVLITSYVFHQRTI